MQALLQVALLQAVLQAVRPNSSASVELAWNRPVVSVELAWNRPVASVELAWNRPVASVELACTRPVASLELSWNCSGTEFQSERPDAFVVFAAPPRRSI